MLPRCRHVDHVQMCIPPGAEAAARDFYEKILGFHKTQKPESLNSRPTQWFQNGDVELHIAVDPVKERTRQHPALVVENIDAVREHLIQHNVKIQDEPVIPDRKRFSFLDPWNNKIEFMEFLKDQFTI
jgi:catechol 2,3-dioxygenase-like lactoylglutathione lyase family enzyme